MPLNIPRGPTFQQIVAWLGESGKVVPDDFHTAAVEALNCDENSELIKVTSSNYEQRFALVSERNSDHVGVESGEFAADDDPDDEQKVDFG